MALKDVYISADIEADGPIPGRYSMLAFGLAVAGSYDGETFARRAPAAATFYRELKPISDEFDVAALKVSGLDRALLARAGADPIAAMHEAAEWVRTQTAGARPVMVGYPVVFDWMFVHGRARHEDDVPTEGARDARPRWTEGPAAGAGVVAAYPQRAR